MMDIIIRELCENDDPYKYMKLLSNLTILNPELIQIKDYMNKLALIKSIPNHKIYIAVIDGIIVGTITTIIEPKFIHNLSNVCHIEDVVVDPLYRNLGIGSKLIDYAIKLGKESGCYKIILDCNKHNIAFYEKKNMKISGSQMAIYMNE